MTKIIFLNNEPTDYKITDNGTCISCKYGKQKIMQPAQLNNGYQMVNLYHHHKLYRMLIHILVANAFVNNTDNLKYVNHIDNDNTNNNASNLAWSNKKILIK